jgi:hypothetical protein
MASKIKKISLAIGRDEFAWAQRRARQEGTSVSAVLTNAARRMREDEAQQAKRDAAWNEVMEWALDGKPLTERELDAARRELDGEQAPKGRSRREPRVA